MKKNKIMKHISNARKAREIVKNAHSSSFFSIEDCETFDVKLLGKTVKRRDIDSLKPEIRRAIKYGAITMGVWKDKERKELWRITRNHYQEWAEEQKQQLIDKLEDWLANNVCNAYNFRGDDISQTFINDCIKAMKGE